MAGRECPERLATPRRLPACRRTLRIDCALKWDLYSDVFETAKAFILVYGKRMYTVIPKRALDGEGQLREVRELLSGAIGDRE
jgi:hypothetical protein